MDSSTSQGRRSEIVFFDLQTTIPSRRGQRHHLLEFGAILVCPRKLAVLDHYATLVRPSDLSAISPSSVNCNGITRDTVVDAPPFWEVAAKVYDILNGRVWAGHNIVRFDCVRIREAFAEIGLPAPVPKGKIDTLTLLTKKFGKRAGNMKMATLATYFGLGEQSHRSLDDVRLNLEVVKYCSTVLFLESSLPGIRATNSWVSSNTTTRIHDSNTRVSIGETSLHTPFVFEEGQGLFPSTAGAEAEITHLVDCNMAKSDSFDMDPPIDQIEEASQPDTRVSIGETSLRTPLVFEEGQGIFPLTAGAEAEITHLVDCNMAKPDSFDMDPPIDQIEEASQPDAKMEEICAQDSHNIAANAVANEGSSGHAGFLDPDEVSVPSVSASLCPYWGQKIQLKHKGAPLQLCCAKLKLRFGVNKRFVDSAGRARMTIVLDASSSLCQVLDVCDNLGQKAFVHSGSSSTWRPVVTRKKYFNSSTIRLNIPTIANEVSGNNSVYATEMHLVDSAGTSHRLVFNRFDATQLDSLFYQGALVDTFFSLEVYDYQQSAGIRLVAKRLIIYSK